MSKSRIPRYVILHKKRGETPLELLARWKSTPTNSSFHDTLASYAGRLDPMAEGKMLVLLGEECKQQDAYTKLDKEYEVEVLLDLKTDTGDVLGFVAYADKNTSLAFNSNEIKKVLQHEVGPRSRKYPSFSSKTVNGKPLFLYSLEGTLNTISIPEHIETIYRIVMTGSYKLTKVQLEDRITESLSLVPRSAEPSKLLGADFRQDEVRTKWKELFSKVPSREFTIIRLSVTCGSGTYMRTLAERIGMSLGTTALAFSINRTKIGKYKSFGAFGIWLKQYK